MKKLKEKLAKRCLHGLRAHLHSWRPNDVGMARELGRDAVAAGLGR